MVNYLYSPDQLPESFIETRQLKKAITHSLLNRQHLLLNEGEIKETATFLADQRHLLGVVAVAQVNIYLDGRTILRNLKKLRLLGRKLVKKYSQRLCPSAQRMQFFHGRIMLLVEMLIGNYGNFLLMHLFLTFIFVFYNQRIPASRDRWLL